MEESNERRSRGSDGGRTPSLSSSSASENQKQQKKSSKRKRRGRGRDKKKRAGAIKDQFKSERLAKTSLRVLYWNCGSINARGRTAEKLAYSADIVCLQETQKEKLSVADFNTAIYNDNGHGQLILVRKGVTLVPLSILPNETRTLTCLMQTPLFVDLKG